MDSIQVFGAERAAAMRREAARLFMPTCAVFVASLCLAGIFNNPLLAIAHAVSGITIGFGGLIFLRIQIVVFASILWLILLAASGTPSSRRIEYEHLGLVLLGTYELIIAVWGSQLFRKAAFILLSSNESNWYRFRTSELILLLTLLAISFGCTMNIPFRDPIRPSAVYWQWVVYWLPINLLAGSVTVWITSIYYARSRAGYKRKI